jgi:cytidylate kinase
MKKIIITLDGYSSCGKSTLAKQMAAHLNYVFIDSGAMYRAITLYFIRHGIDLTNVVAVHEALAQIQLSFVLNEKTGRADMYLNHENVEEEIRGLAVSNQVSQVAALEHVRIFSVAQQQLMGEQKE